MGLRSFQRQRRDMFIDYRAHGNLKPGGAAWLAEAIGPIYAAPTELDFRCGANFYKHGAPPELWWVRAACRRFSLDVFRASLLATRRQGCRRSQAMRDFGRDALSDSVR